MATHTTAIPQCPLLLFLSPASNYLLQWEECSSLTTCIHKQTHARGRTLGLISKPNGCSVFQKDSIKQSSIKLLSCHQSCSATTASCSSSFLSYSHSCTCTSYHLHLGSIPVSFNPHVKAATGRILNTKTDPGVSLLSVTEKVLCEWSLRCKMSWL